MATVGDTHGMDTDRDRDERARDARLDPPALGMWSADGVEYHPTHAEMRAALQEEARRGDSLRVLQVSRVTYRGGTSEVVAVEWLPGGVGDLREGDDFIMIVAGRY